MSTPTMTEDQLASLSDDEIMNMVSAPQINGEEAEETTDAGGDQAPDQDLDGAADGAGSAADVLGADDAADDAEAEESQADEEQPDDKPAEADKDPAAAQKTAEGDPETGAEKAAELKSDDAKSAEAAPVDYKAVYEKIMAPFKAAGKTIQLTSPDDVIQLMQMGAHYTKKMQALQPNLKLLRMLENNDLLDEGKLSFLLDINRKDPAAIQKLIKESGLDPLEIDTTTEPEYRPGNHKVSDQEIMFTTTLEEVASDPAGKDLILTINRTWDAASKEALWGDPHILKVLTAHRETGIYDQISAEIEHRRTLGYLGNEPFLQAYQAVGKEMQAQGRLTPRPSADGTGAPDQGGQPGQSRQVLETRPAQRKTVAHSDKARAASPTKATPRKPTAPDFNPLALSDEDFEKQAELARRL